MSELAVKPVPRRGRIFVVAILALFLFGLGYLVVEVAVQGPNENRVEVEGAGDMQRIFGGVPQEGERVGSADAPVTIQVFNDLQCAECREDYLSTIPSLVEDYARPGDAKLLWRHYSNARNVHQLGFYGAEAAAEQNYGWQYTYLFFVNQEEAEGLVDEDFLEAIAAAIAGMDQEEWKAALAADSDSEGPITERLDEDEELARDLGIRTRQAAIVSGPNGTETLQDGARLEGIEAAIAAVE